MLGRVMENQTINGIHRSFILFTFSTVFLWGCQSTPPEEPNTECRADTAKNCPAEQNNGEDRGYNPCLVNKALPVCKK